MNTDNIRRILLLSVFIRVHLWPNSSLLGFNGISDRETGSFIFPTRPNCRGRLQEVGVSSRTWGSLFKGGPRFPQPNIRNLANNFLSSVALWIQFRYPRVRLLHRRGQSVRHRELPILLSQVGPATGLVNGSKLKHQNPAHRVWIGKVYNLCARLLFHIRIRDIDYQKTPCREGHRRGTTSAVLVAARWPVLK
jgi:hypothetical protein